jgi:hypothetical protein
MSLGSLALLRPVDGAAIFVMIVATAGGVSGALAAPSGAAATPPPASPGYTQCFDYNTGQTTLEHGPCSLGNGAATASHGGDDDTGQAACAGVENTSVQRCKLMLGAPPNKNQLASYRKCIAQAQHAYQLCTGATSSGSQ